LDDPPAVRSLDGLEAAVVGGGIGGATAALLLARAGARVTLLERGAEPRAVGAGILLQPNGLAVLYGLGLEEPLTRHGHVARSARVEDAAGRPILDQPVPDYGAGLDHVVALRRSRLLAVLHDALAAEGRITLQLGVPVASATADGAVEYTLAGEPRRLAADLVVAANGRALTAARGRRLRRPRAAERRPLPARHGAGPAGAGPGRRGVDTARPLRHGPDRG
jgi:2-polyprenyl-6-methoxyphenol hydroxylase-like FAD-dependent oxidoreductase